MAAIGRSCNLESLVKLIWFRSLAEAPSLSRLDITMKAR